MENSSHKPGSDEYNVERPQDLNIPEFNSTSESRASHELPAVEHLDEEHQSGDEEKNRSNMEQQKKMPPKPDLGNKRDDDEEEHERLITP